MANTQLAAEPAPLAPDPAWWRSAVIYQIYPRSFSDANGDGIGDLPGMIARLPAIADLGVDAIWLSPFYPSPQNDAGYDVSDYCDVDPRFGTLRDFDTLLEQAHDRGIRVIVDLVPNHSSSEHVWFKEALAAGPGSPERARYIFRDGLGPDGELPPNNWRSVFGGGAWTRVTEPDGSLGQWYLHIFDSTQPDFDWTNRWVRDRFLEVLAFWLDRGVDGFRVDVAHGLAKEDGLPDYPEGHDGSQIGPHWGQPLVHEIYREWRAHLDTYTGSRILCAEAWVNPLSSLAEWVRSDEMHQAFNFPFLAATWDATALHAVITDSITSFGAVQAPATWVLSNHDVVRHATRLGLPEGTPLFDGIGPGTPGLPDPRIASRRARAATALMLSLPGSAYLYQGEELGLPEAIELPDDSRQDPTWHRTEGRILGRDGSRVPIPWERDEPAFGFSPTGLSWLPQPDEWAELARDTQRSNPASSLNLYREALRLRRQHRLGTRSLTWLRVEPDLLDFLVDDVRVVVNFGPHDRELPAGNVILGSSGAVEGNTLPADTTVWLTESS